MTSPLPPHTQPTTATTTTTTTTTPQGNMHNHLPRITIKYCTQCKWLLRAAYFAQELLSTFSTQLGEVALVPATGGVFTVTMYHSSSTSSTGTQGEEVGTGTGTGEDVDITETILWDRKTNGGFPGMSSIRVGIWDIRIGL
ncbi:Rdx family-domain-containing protein [Aspergillus welwitschiae]|uniref:Rdx family-domain-containing protein n=1 Tax=Aspergillus welwitschiae TaxID=1341132 RepID=A0A3F3PPK9_9EURO|nr:Rdx family-domain-containing protein [Aspergillus welwitschiae]RDH28256.1 Rdx family-domain-containing protein [Aspergillus welwitschiae]